MLLRTKSKLTSGLNTAPLRAAIYCRKSTDDSDKDDELRSTAMQEANARQYAEKRGWIVLADQVYRDENVSGARISRVGFDRVLSALGIEDGKSLRSVPDPAMLPFDVLIVRDQSRLIRNAEHALRLIRRLSRSGVAICYYKTGELLDRNFNPMVAGVQGIVDSQKREESRKDVREGLEERAQRGWNVGGCCFGYDNLPVMGTMPSGQPKRLYTDFKINELQADVVRRIFRMYSAGHGPRVIAKTANGDPRYRAESRRFFDGKRPSKPAVGKRGSGSWAPSAVRDILRNERYIGVLTFGRMKNEYDEDGIEFRIKQPEREKIVTKERPDLRIISPDLWHSAQKRIKAMKKSYSGNKDPHTGRYSPYLASGVFPCPECAAPYIAHKMSHGSGSRRTYRGYYVCSWNNKRGSTVCGNNLRIPMDELDEQLLTLIQRDVLTPGRIDRALRKAEADARTRLRKDPQLRKNLEADIKRLAQAKDNLISLSAYKLDDPESVAKKLNEYAEQLRRLEFDLANLADRHDPARFEEKRLQMKAKLARFNELMRDRRNVALARQVLQQGLGLANARLDITGVNGRRAWAIRGTVRLNSRPFDREQLASPRGFGNCSRAPSNFKDLRKASATPV